MPAHSRSWPSGPPTARGAPSWRPPGLKGAAALLRAAALGALLGGAAGAAGTPVGTLTLADAFQPPTANVSGPATYVMEIVSTEAQPLTGLSLTSDLSAALVSVSASTSSCGGSFSVTGGVVAFSGGALPAAPSTQNPARCRLEIRGTTRATTGTVTVATEVGALGNDQNLTNDARTATSLSVLSLQAIKLSTLTDIYDPANRWAYLGGGDHQGTGGVFMTTLRLHNPNSTPVSGTVATLEVLRPHSVTPRADLDLSRTACWTGNPGALSPGPLVAGSEAMLAGALSPGGLGRWTLGPVTLPPGAVCDVAVIHHLDVEPDISLNQNYWTIPKGNVAAITVSANDIDPRLNTTLTTPHTRVHTVDVSAYYDGEVNSNVLLRTGPLKVELNLNNLSNLTQRVSLREALPAGLSIDPASLQAGTYRMPNETRNAFTPSSGGYGSIEPATPCPLEGVSFDAATHSLVLERTPLPPKVACRYWVTATRPSTAGWTRTLRASDITVENTLGTASWPGNAAVAAQASLTANSPFVASAALGSTSQESPWILSGAASDTYISEGRTVPGGVAQLWVFLSNQAGYTGGAVQATATLPGTLRLIPSSVSCTIDNQRQCAERGVVLTVTPTGISVSAPSMSAGGHIAVNAHIEPDSLVEANNLSPAITYTVGGVPGRTFANVFRVLEGARLASGDYSAPPLLAVGRPHAVSFEVNNFYARAREVVVSASLPAGVQMDTTAPVIRVCRSLGVTETLSASQVVLTPSSLQITDTLPAATYRSPDDANQMCRYTITVIPQTVGDMWVPGQLTMDGVVRGPTAWSGQPVGAVLRYTAVAGQTYQLTQSFDKLTSPAGADVTLAAMLRRSDGTVPSVYYSLTLRLPPGMIVSPDLMRPNQPDGRYVSPGFSTGSGIAEPCIEISADRRTLISRCTNPNTGVSVKVKPMRYGDLINTITPADVSIQDGAVDAPSSASTKVTRGLVAVLSLSPAQVKAGDTSQLEVWLTNVAAPGESDNTLSARVDWSATTSGVSPSPPPGPLSVTGCGPGVTATRINAWQMQLSGVVLAAGADCRAVITVPAWIRSPVAITQTAYVNPGQATSTSGATNAQTSSASQVITPLQSCVAPTGVTGTLRAGQSTTLVGSLRNAGEGPLVGLSAALQGSSGSPAWTVSFGGAPGSTNPQTAWANWLAAHPEGLASGESLEVRFTFTVATSASGTQSVTLSLNPTDGASCGAVTLTASGTVVRPVLAATTAWQAECEDAGCAGATWTQAAVNLAPCRVLGRELRSVLAPTSGPLAQAKLSSSWPADLHFLSASAALVGTFPEGAVIAWQVGEEAPSRTAPTALTAGQSVRAWVDLDGDLTLSAADQLEADQGLTLRLVGQVAGCP